MPSRRRAPQVDRISELLPGRPPAKHQSVAGEARTDEHHGAPDVTRIRSTGAGVGRRTTGRTVATVDASRQTRRVGFAMFRPSRRGRRPATTTRSSRAGHRAYGGTDPRQDGEGGNTGPAEQSADRHDDQRAHWKARQAMRHGPPAVVRVPRISTNPIAWARPGRGEKRSLWDPIQRQPGPQAPSWTPIVPFESL